MHPITKTIISYAIIGISIVGFVYIGESIYIAQNPDSRYYYDRFIESCKQNNTNRAISLINKGVNIWAAHYDTEYVNSCRAPGMAAIICIGSGKYVYNRLK